MKSTTKSEKRKGPRQTRARSQKALNDLDAAGAARRIKGGASPEDLKAKAENRMAMEALKSFQEALKSAGQL